MASPAVVGRISAAHPPAACLTVEWIQVAFSQRRCGRERLAASSAVVARFCELRCVREVLRAPMCSRGSGTCAALMYPTAPKGLRLRSRHGVACGRREDKRSASAGGLPHGRMDPGGFQPASMWSRASCCELRCGREVLRAPMCSRGSGTCAALMYPTAPKGLRLRSRHGVARGRRADKRSASAGARLAAQDFAAFPYAASPAAWLTVSGVPKRAEVPRRREVRKPPTSSTCRPPESAALRP